MSGAGGIVGGGGAQTLRPYQQAGVEAIRQQFALGRRRVVYVLPTGGGKTTVAAAMIRAAVARGNKVLFLAHRQELIDQASERLDGVGVDHGVIMGNHPRHRPGPVQVASIQTISRRGLPWVPDLVFVDEAHRIKGNQYARLVEGLPSSWVVGITATPVRTDGKGLSPPFDAMVLGPTVAELTGMGYLVPSRVYARRKPDLSGVRTAAGDYQQDELQLAMNRPELVGDVVREWQRHAAGRLTAVFAVGVEHSIALRDAFRAVGVAAEHIDGETPADTRRDVLRALEAGRVQVVCNCAVLTEGWDCPPVSAVSVVRPTQSLALWLQMAGRGLRPVAGKADCVILDHGGCVYRHGLITADRQWTLDGEEAARATKRTKDVADAVKVCDECGAVAEPSAAECPACGAPFPRPKREMPEVVDGELELVKDARPVSEEQKRRAYLRFLWQQNNLRRGDGSPYSAAYAMVKFRATFGHPPKRGWREEFYAGRGA